MGEDGSIVFDTELDQSGFEKGTQKLLNAIKDLVDTVDNLGDNMMRSFGQIVPLLQSVATAAAGINQKLAETASQTATANEEVVASEERVAQAAQNTVEAVNQQNQSVQDFTSSAKAAQGGANAMAQTSGSYEKAMQRVQKQIDGLKAKMADYYTAVAEIQKSTDESLALADTDEQAAKVMEMEEVQLEKLNSKYASKLEALKNLEAEYERLAALQAQQNASSDPAAWDSTGLAAQVDKAIQAIDQYEEKMAKMSYMGATDSQWQSIYYDITQANYKLDEYKASLDRMHDAGEIDNSDYERLSVALDQARQKAEQLAAATQESRSIVDIFKQAGRSALALAGNIAKIPLGAARAGFKKLGQSVSEYIKKAQNAKLTSNALVKSLMSVKRMLISRVKRMFISQIFDGAKESLAQLAQYSVSFGAAINRIKTAAAGVKNNLAVTFGGLIEAVEPVITKLLTLLSKAITYVNAFFGLMRGKTTMTTAAQSTNNYSNNMATAAKNTQKAAKEQEKLNRAVYGFDDLNKRNKEDEEEEEENNDNPLSGFTDTPIDDVLPQDLKDYFQELKDLWDNEDYFGFGHKLAEKLNEMMQIADDWINNVFRPMGVKWAKNIAEVLNGLVDGFDAKLLGKLLADGLNAVFDIVNTFLETFDFDKFGTRIGETISSWFTNVEWDLIGKTFANGVNSIIDTLHGLVNAIDWDTVGKSISEFFNYFATGINWNKLVKTVSDGIKGLETAVLNFVKGIKWREIADMLAESLGNLDIASILTKAGQIISEIMKGIMSFIAEFIKKVDWSGLLQGIWDGLVGLLQSIDWGGLISTAFELLGAAVGAASNLAATLISNILNLLVSGFEDAWSYFGDYIDKCGGDIVAGLLLGIVNALVNIGQWIWDHIFKPFWDGLCHAFGIASPSTKMMEIGGYIIAGLLEGIKAAWNGITTFFSTALETVKTAINNAWTAITTGTSMAWTGIKTTISNAWTGISTTVSTVTTTVKTAMSTAWEIVKTNAAMAWDNVKTTISTKFDAVKTSVKTTADTVKSTLTTSWTGLKTEATNKWKAVHDEIKRQYDNLKQPIKTTTDAVKKTLTDSWYNIQNEARTKWDYIKQNITRPMDDISRNMTYAWNQIRNDTSRTWESIRYTIMDKWNSLKSAVSQSANSDWGSIGSRLVEGLKNGISRAWSGLTSMVSRLASGLTGFINRLFGIHSPSRVWAEIGEYLDLGLIKGLEDTQGKVMSTVANLAEGVGDEMQIEDASVDLETGVDGASDSLTRIADMLSGIADTFQRITDMLNSMGGLQIPALVSGSVVPSRTAVSGDDRDMLDSPRFDSFVSDLDERLFDQNSLLERILAAITNRRGLDADELADAIAFSMGNAIRGYGGV